MDKPSRKRPGASRTVTFAAAVVALLFAGTLQAQSRPATAPAVDGAWELTLATGDGQPPVAVKASFKTDGAKLSGTIVSPDGETALVGEFAARKIAFTIRPDAAHPDFVIPFTGELQTDDTLAGTFRGPDGLLRWTGKRSK